jgi:CTP synthase (UTP-ammonia lyase)
MAKNLKQLTISLDNRIDVESSNIYTDIQNYCKIIKKYLHRIDNYNGEKIIIHSDSAFLKDEIIKLDSNYIKLDLKIQHVAENIGDTELNSFIDTITEFYILAKAKFIFVIAGYSGFSHLSSMVYKKKLYTLYNSHYFDRLHCNNINII